MSRWNAVVKRGKCSICGNLRPLLSAQLGGEQVVEQHLAADADRAIGGTFCPGSEQKPIELVVVE